MKRATLFAMAMLASCGDSSSADVGRDQPVRVRNDRVQFFAGAMPHDQGGPHVVTLDSPNNRVRRGFVGKLLSGNASKGSYALGIRFSDLGSGYFTVPVEDLDPITDGEVQYHIDLELAPDAPIGRHPFELVAFDADGHAGPLYPQDFEIRSDLPPGRVVVSLAWNSPADLDLVVVTPSGKRVDPKHPTTAMSGDAGVDAADPSVGVIDRDSNANCLRDGYDQEDLVFAGMPAPGPYRLGVEMVSGCGATAATYTLTVVVDGKTVAETAGRLVEAIDATGGGKPVAPVLTFSF